MQAIISKHFHLIIPSEKNCFRVNKNVGNYKDFISSLMLYLDWVRKSCWQKRGELLISLWSCAFREGVGLLGLTPQLRALESQRQTTKEQKQKHKDFLLFVKIWLTFSKNLRIHLPCEEMLACAALARYKTMKWWKSYLLNPYGLLSRWQSFW